MKGCGLVAIQELPRLDPAAQPRVLRSFPWESTSSYLRSTLRAGDLNVRRCRFSGVRIVLEVR